MKNKYLLLTLASGLILAPNCKKEKNKEHKKTSKVQMERGDAMATTPEDAAACPLRHYRILHARFTPEECRFRYTKTQELNETIRDEPHCLNIVKDTLDEYPEIINLNPWGITPLMAACMEKNEEIVRYLLDQPGIDVNAVDPVNLYSALYWAEIHRNREIIQMLLDAGARRFDCG